MIIGVTGNSGTGKTKIAKILAEKINAEIIDADKTVKEMTNTETKYLKEIIKLFGKEILTENKLNRKKLAEIIYSDNSKKEQLNNLTYKYVVDEIKNKIKKIENKNIIIDAPLLFESKLDKICNFTISVLAEKEIKLDRICKRDNISKETAEARLNIQENDEYYIQKSDYVIKNNRKIDEINLEEICTRVGKN